MSRELFLLTPAHLIGNTRHMRLSEFKTQIETMETSRGIRLEVTVTRGGETVFNQYKHVPDAESVESYKRTLAHLMSAASAKIMLDETWEVAENG